MKIAAIDAQRRASRWKVEYECGHAFTYDAEPSPSALCPLCSEGTAPEQPRAPAYAWLADLDPPHGRKR